MFRFLTRDFALDDLRVRSDGRTIDAVCVPWDVPAPVNDAEGRYAESWQRGAFARTIAERGHKLPVLANHDRRSLPLGRVTHLAETDRGLEGSLHLSQTVAADEMLTLVNDGAIRGVSISFRPIKSAWNRARSAVTRVEAALSEVSLVAFPTWEGAEIVGIRSDVEPLSTDDARRRLQLLTLKGR